MTATPPNPPPLTPEAFAEIERGLATQRNWVMVPRDWLIELVRVYRAGAAEKDGGK